MNENQVYSIKESSQVTFQDSVDIAKAAYLSLFVYPLIEDPGRTLLYALESMMRRSRERNINTDRHLSSVEIYKKYKLHEQGVSTSILRKENFLRDSVVGFISLDHENEKNRNSYSDSYTSILMSVINLPIEKNIDDLKLVPAKTILGWFFENPTNNGEERVEFENVLKGSNAHFTTKEQVFLYCAIEDRKPWAIAVIKGTIENPTEMVNQLKICVEDFMKK